MIEGQIEDFFLNDRDRNCGRKRNTDSGEDEEF